jgi:glycerate 2-kinase
MASTTSLTARAALSSAIRAAISAASPVSALRSSIRFEGRFISRNDTTTTCLDTLIDLTGASSALILGAGKASVALAAELVTQLSTQLNPPLPISPNGIVITKDGHASEADTALLSSAGIALRFAGHPQPDARGAAAAAEMLHAVSTTVSPSTAVFLCISGGASSLTPAPAEGITLSDLIALNDALLACGAPIEDVNSVRKHCSKFSGGRLGAAVTRGGATCLVTLVISDVVGDRLDVIGSGPTTLDTSTFADAIHVLEERRISPPKSVWEHLQEGVNGRREETEKSHQRNHVAWIIASNVASTTAAAVALEKCGFKAHIITNALEGEARLVARDLAIALKATPIGTALIYGGETTVTLGAMRGLGGRNQELALALALEMGGEGGGANGVGWVAVCLATDGTDGPTDAAGAYATSSTLHVARSLHGLDAAVALDTHESYAFWKVIGSGGGGEASRDLKEDNDALPPLSGQDGGGLLMTGGTGTNVMDVTMLIRYS